MMMTAAAASEDAQKDDDDDRSECHSLAATLLPLRLGKHSTEEDCFQTKQFEPIGINCQK